MRKQSHADGRERRPLLEDMLRPGAYPPGALACVEETEPIAVLRAPEPPEEILERYRGRRVAHFVPASSGVSPYDVYVLEPAGENHPSGGSHGRSKKR